MSNDGVTIKLIVQEPWGGKTHVMAVGSDEFPIFSERMVSEMRAGLSGMSFERTVGILKERQFRRELLKEAAKVLALRMADHLEDSEGWHGERRARRIQEQTK